jgi:hypothetical protein
MLIVPHVDNMFKAVAPKQGNDGVDFISPNIVNSAETLYKIQLIHGLTTAQPAENINKID